MRRPHLLALALLLLSSPAWANDWTQYRGPDSLGVMEAGLPGGEGELGLDVAWIRDLGSGYSGVAVQGNLAVTLFAAGESDVVAAFDRVSGDELWRHTLEPTYKGHDGSHDGPIASPLIADGRVYVLGAWGQTAALDLETGAEVWAVHLVEDLEIEKPWYGFGSSPITTAGSVVVGGAGKEGTLVALALESGEVRWRAGTDAINYQSPILTSLAGREQVVIGAEASVFAVDPSSGELLWTYEHGGGGARGAASLTVLPLGDDRLFVDHDDHLSALLEVQAAEAGFTVEKIWEDKALINSYIPPIQSAGSLFGYSTRFFTAVDPATGKTLFRSREPGDGFPIVIDDQMVILTKAGTLHLGPVPADGWSETGSIELFEEHSWTPPSFVDGSLFVRSFGQLARVDLVRGAARSAVTSELPPRIAAISSAADAAAAADRMLAESTPPWIDGNQVTFVWRGDATDVGIGGDVIGVRAEEPMHRVEGTDLWWWAGTVPDGMRFSYSFLVDYVPTLDPHNPRNEQMSIYGPDMNFARAEDPVEMSWMAMPGWEQPDHWADLPEGGARGTLHELSADFQPEAAAESEESEESEAPEAPEAPEPVNLEFAVWVPPGYDESDATYPVIYAVDAAARRAGRWTNTLDRLTDDGLTPAIVVFVEPINLRGPAAGQAFHGAIVAQVESQFRVNPDARSLAGAGGASVGALMLALSQPGFAQSVAVQSIHTIEAGMAPLYGMLDAATEELLPLDFYIEWGSLDLRAIKEGWDTRRLTKDFFDNVKNRGYSVEGGEVVDSTDWSSWRNRTDRVLRALLPAAANVAPSGSR